MLKSEFVKTRFKLAGLFHMTAVDNLDGILHYGIMPKNLAIKNGLQKCDIAAQDIQARRDTVVVKSGKTLHDYASFYFNPRNAMQYRVAHGNQYGTPRQIVIIGVKLSILDYMPFLFTNQNASIRHGTNFYTDLNDLAKLDWKTVFADTWCADNLIEKSMKKACMQAEMLIEGVVGTEFIGCIFCQSQNIQKTLSLKYPNYRFRDPHPRLFFL